MRHETDDVILTTLIRSVREGNVFSLYVCSQGEEGFPPTLPPINKGDTPMNPPRSDPWRMVSVCISAGGTPLA